MTACGSDLYSFPQAGSYLLNAGGVLAPQQSCLYLDALLAVNDPLEDGAIFLPTRITTLNQVITPAASCAGLAHSYCAWNTTSSSVVYMADPEFFTLLIDHSFSSTVGIDRSSAQMSGAILGTNGKPLNPCDAYANFTAGCASNITVGQLGARDILPLQTLLLAAGITNLDLVAAHSNINGLNTQTHRYAGIVLVVNIVYTNYALAAPSAPRGTGVINDGNVEYYYTVSAIPDESFKSQQAVTSTGQVRKLSYLHFVHHDSLRLHLRALQWRQAALANNLSFSGPHTCGLL